jgi:hypothetical protein
LRLHWVPSVITRVTDKVIIGLGGQCKTGHAGSLQNRPCEMARDVILILFIPLSPDQASLFWFSNSSVHI